MNEFITRDVDNLPILKVLIPYLKGHNGFIAGGCFKNLFQHEHLKDIDMFFENETEWTKAKMYFDESIDYSFYYENKKVIAYKHINTGVMVELIHSVFGTPESVISNFDFSITKFAYFLSREKDEDGNDVETYKAIHHKDFFEHLFFKRLVIDAPLSWPVGTFERAMRYKGYGYSLCRESKTNLIKAIREVQNPSDDVSGELYAGVD